MSNTKNDPWEQSLIEALRRSVEKEAAEDLEKIPDDYMTEAEYTAFKNQLMSIYDEHSSKHKRPSVMLEWLRDIADTVTEIGRIWEPVASHTLGLGYDEVKTDELAVHYQLDDLLRFKILPQHNGTIHMTVELRTDRRVELTLLRSGKKLQQKRLDAGTRSADFVFIPEPDQTLRVVLDDDPAFELPMPETL